MIKAFVVLTLILSLTNNSYSQKLVYDILIKNDTIGFLIAEKICAGNESHYIISTRAKIKFLFTFSLENVFKASYLGSRLNYSFTRNVINDKEKERTETIWDLNSYIIDYNGEKITEINNPIHFSVACLYHQIPNNQQEIYSERFCSFLPIKKIEDRIFQLTLPDHKHNQYFYNIDGICEKVEVEQTLANLTILLRR